MVNSERAFIYSFLSFTLFYVFVSRMLFCVCVSRMLFFVYFVLCVRITYFVLLSAGYRDVVWRSHVHVSRTLFCCLQVIVMWYGDHTFTYHILCFVVCRLS